MGNDVKLKVYLETSFVSYLTGGATPNAKIAADQAYTRLWWERERTEVDVFVSGYTLAECEDGNATRATERLDAIRDVPVLPDRSEEVVSLARKLIDGHALPEGERNYGCLAHRHRSRKRDGCVAYVELQAHGQPSHASKDATDHCWCGVLLPCHNDTKDIHREYRNGGAACLILH